MVAISQLHPRCSTKVGRVNDIEDSVVTPASRRSITTAVSVGFKLKPLSSSVSLQVNAVAQDSFKGNGVSVEVVSKKQTINKGRDIDGPPGLPYLSKVIAPKQAAGQQIDSPPDLNRILPEDVFVSRQTFGIRSYEIGYDRRATFQTLMNYSQESVINYMRASGLAVDGFFGVTPAMHRRDLIWVFSRMQATVDCYPSWGDVVQADTWLSLEKNNPCFHCLLRDEKTGKRVMEASSYTIMINKHTRKLSKFVDEVRAEMEPYCGTCFPILHKDQGRLKRLEEDRADYIRRGLRPQWSDLDVNEHVNNVKIVSWILEGIPTSIRNSFELGSISVEYRRECGIESNVESVSAASGDGYQNFTLDHLLRLEDGPEVTRAKTIWRPKGKKQLSGYH